jgi:hypothetical protein
MAAANAVGFLQALEAIAGGVGAQGRRERPPLVRMDVAALHQLGHAGDHFRASRAIERLRLGVERQEAECANQRCGELLQHDRRSPRNLASLYVSAYIFLQGSAG